MLPTPLPERRRGALVRHRAHAPHRGRLWSALSVVLASMGCAPPGPQAAESATDTLAPDGCTWVRRWTPDISYLRAGDPTGPRVILVHGTPGSATAWADYLLDPPRRPGTGGARPARLRPQRARRRVSRSPRRPPPSSRCCPPTAAVWCCWAIRSAGRSSRAWRPSTRTRVTALVLLAASLDPALEEIHPMQWVGAWAPVRALLPRVLRNANAELMALQARAGGAGADAAAHHAPRC